MCLEFGFSSDPVAILLRAGFNVLECYKVVIQTLMDWSQWSPEFLASGKLFDVCQSSITSNAQVFRLSLYQETSSYDNMLFDDIEFTGASPRNTMTTGSRLCWDFPYLFDGTGFG